MNSLGSCISTFGRYKKVNPKNELGELLVFLLLTTLHFEKDLNLLHSAKCSVSTQLTYIQKKYSKTRFQSVQSKILQGQSLKLLEYLFTLRIEYFSTLKYFVIFWDFWSFGYLATLVFSQLLVPICKFLQNQDRCVELWFLPKTLVKQNHKTLPNPKIAKNTKITSNKHKMKT